jgi:hypothetical protein
LRSLRGIGRLLAIGPGEGRIAAQLGVLMLATSAGAAMGAAATEALLFAHFDLAKLPLLYVALGATTFACTLVASGLLAGGDRARIYVVLPAALAAVVAAERVAAISGLGWVYAVLWLGMNVVTTLQGIGAWGLAGAVCDVRQSKRLFPLFNAARIAGAVAGSLAVTVAVRVVAVVDLLVVWALALAIAAAIAHALRTRVPRSADAPPGAGLVAEMRRGFGIVRDSPLLRILAVALVFFSLLYFSLALPFSRGARETYADAADLAVFLGLFNGATTLAALGASLFVANRLYARIGVVNAIVAFAGVYLAGFAAIAVSGAFAVLVAARFAQTVWLTGIADTAYQALFNPVPPERRDQIRAFMEGVPGQAGIALAGVALLLGDALDPRSVALGGVVASLVTVWLLLRARPAYGRALADALRSGRPQPFVLEADPFGALRTDADALAVALSGLRSTDAAVRRVSAEILRQLALPRTADALTAALDDDDADVRASAVAALATLGIAAPLARFARDADPAIRVRVALAPGDGPLPGLVTDPDPETREAVAHVLAERTAPPTAALAALLRDPVPAVRRAALRAVSDARGLDQAELEPLLDDDDPVVEAGAFEVLGRRGDDAARSRLSALARDDVARASADCERLRRLGEPRGDLQAFVADALRERAERPAARVVRATLALAGRGDAGLVLESLASADRERRASAVELLEAQGGALVRPLLALWERPAVEADQARMVLSELAGADPDDLVRGAARRAIDGGGGMETLPTISLLERLLFLRKVSLFAGLAPSDLKQVARLAREDLHVDGAVLAREGEVGDRMYVIAAGTVQIVNKSGNVRARRTAGDAVGELSLVTDQPRNATLVCEGAVRVLTIGRREFDAILRDRPEVARAIIGVLGARLTELTAA